MEQKDFTFKKYLLTSIALFISSLILILVLTLGWLAVIGIPVGLLLMSFSIWHFAMWFYKKKVHIKTASILFILPLLSVVSFVFEHGAYVWEHNNIPLGQTRVAQPYPVWVIIAPFVSIISWITGITLIILFFRKVKNL